MLDADIQLRLGKFSLDAAFGVAPGEVVALLGPNGSGKSTVLKALTGLLPLAGGRVELDGAVLEDPATRTKVPPEKRPVALMFQDYLLFPHLSALENVAFGLRSTGTGKDSARRRAADALAQVGLSDHAGKRPGAMSGGQQQRVAMARALVTQPKLLLLDEPLAALDVSTKTDVRRLLRANLRNSGAANILVTHDLLDAVALGDRMIVIENGTVVQEGTPAEVTGRPRSRYVADLTGVNLLAGTAAGTTVTLDDGGELTCAEPASGPVFAVIAPARVTVHRERPVVGGPNQWRGRIGDVDLMGDRVRVRVEGAPSLSAEVPPSAVDDLKLDDGGELWASVDPAAVTVYGRDQPPQSQPGRVPGDQSRNGAARGDRDPRAAQ
jgi:molybdate transport system ATP-binding protein